MTAFAAPAVPVECRAGGSLQQIGLGGASFLYEGLGVGARIPATSFRPQAPLTVWAFFPSTDRII